MPLVPEAPLCERAREITAGSWIFAHNDGRKLDYHNDEGVGCLWEGKLTGGPIREFKTWVEVRADLVTYAHGTQLPVT